MTDNFKIHDFDDGRIYNGDVLECLRDIPDGFVQCVVTSPPYFGLRDYGAAGQIGLEKTMDDYVQKLVAVFRELRRVLRADGTLWLNLGDSYASGKGTCPGGGETSLGQDKKAEGAHPLDRGNVSDLRRDGLKPKDLCGVPWRLALALQANGWWLRQDIIWAKTNPMPESVTDRNCKSHEYIFLLTKRPQYYYDGVAIAERAVSHDNKGECGSGLPSMQCEEGQPHGRGGKSAFRGQGHFREGQGPANRAGRDLTDIGSGPTRTRRDVWMLSLKAYKGAHFACFPPEIPELCIKAGTSEKGCCPKCGAPWERVLIKERVATRPGTDTKVTGDQMTDGNRDPERHVTTTTTTGWQPTCKCGEIETTPCVVLDLFMGSGTTAQVARQLGRRFIGIELNEKYIPLIYERLEKALLPPKKLKSKKGS
jgi:DNA modification methylase